MNKYKIEVSERLAKIIEVNAETEQEAMTEIKELYKNKKIILKSDTDYVDNDFEIVEVQEIQINQYETICLLNTTAKIEEINNLTNKIKEIFNNVEEIENIGIRKLAYKIKDNENAYYIKAIVKGTTENVSELEKYYRLNDTVIKFITLTIESGV